MAPRIGQRVFDTPTLVFMGAFIVIFILLIGKHYEIGGSTLKKWDRNLEHFVTIAGNRLGLLDTCGEEEFIAFSATVYVCNNANQEFVYGDIYYTYPATIDGREIIYSFLDNGDRARADEILGNTYYLERYGAVTLPSPLTWTEDPYGERYWRFLFYSLRPTRHVLAAAEETDNPAYYAKMREIVGSFIETGSDQTFAWDDAHGVAFRTMILVNTWWKLREAGELPIELSDKILASLEEHGAFLYDPAHYEADYNHGVTQAAALFLLAEAFPDLPNAPVWRETALTRIATGLGDVVDEDGVLVENSPYYHFYTLEKYWEIYRYANEFDIEISADFNETIEKMVNHATYILQPDLDMPLLGASIPRPILRSGEFREIANQDEEFNYVMTQGKEGRPPSEENLIFPSSGIALLRSGWGQDRPYEDEMQLVFDTGPYRTDHSDLDALTFSLYAQGMPIIRDTGLYTYEEDHPLYEYFHGTNGHNTVMVDGGNQQRGAGTAGEIIEGDGYAALAARHTLYPGVTHNRAIVRIENAFVLVLDDLESGDTHDYDQLFHLAPGASVRGDDGRLIEGEAVKEGKSVPYRITQLAPADSLRIWHDDRTSGRGQCAVAYETLVPCYELSYREEGTNARYITAIQVGDAGLAYEVSQSEEGTIVITTPTRIYTVQPTFPTGSGLIELSIDADIRTDVRQPFTERIKAFFTNLF